MSHSLAKIKCADGTIYYAEYNGTVDVIIPGFYPNQEVLDAKWRSGEWRECKGDPSCLHEAAEYAVGYASGTHGRVTVCRTCMCVTDAAAFYDLDQLDWARGLPDWWKLDSDAEGGGS